MPLKRLDLLTDFSKRSGSKGRRRFRLGEKGYNLVELAMAVLILGAIAASVIVARNFMAKQTQNNSDKAYAGQKAIQMYEELRAIVNTKGSVQVLDSFSNGSSFDKILTTDTSVDTGASSANPGDPLSGNRVTNGHWRYLRQVLVNQVANDPYARQVIVQVWLRDSDQNPNSPTMVNGPNGLVPGPTLATVGGIMRVSQGPFPPTQVMDVYVLDLYNVSAWWAPAPKLDSTFDFIASDLQSLNPGLQLRVHKIIRTAYGRDADYVPYINQAQGSDVAAMPWVYFYPGSVPELSSPDGCGCESYFYNPASNGIPLCGNFNVDGSVQSTSSTWFSGCPSFSVADQYNHGLRYPDEVSTYQAVTQAWATVAAANPKNPPPFPEISWRMLIEGMLSSPQSFTNAIIFNMHGELMPLPPMHNYSDAAKDPANLCTAPNASPSIYPNTYLSSAVTLNDAFMRVVTHPELIYYPQTSPSNASVTLKLRVYAYFDGWQDQYSSVTSVPGYGGDPKAPAISLYFPDIPNAVNSYINAVTAVVGSSAVVYKDLALPSVVVGGAMVGLSDGESIKAQAVGPSNNLLITLYNTRLTCPNGPSTYTVGGGDTQGGLFPGDQLYGLEYIPCSPEVNSGSWGSYPTYTFTGQDLSWDPSAGTAPAGGHPKNTARWVISLALPVTTSQSTGIHTIETRLGDGVTTSVISTSSGNSSIYTNLSRTWVWTGDAFPPPTTEQYQFLGDPRHCPYLDVKVGGPGEGGGQAATIQSLGYNWWFKNMGKHGLSSSSYNSDGYTAFAGNAGNTLGWNGNAGWALSLVDADIPRYYEVIRKGLLNTNSIYTTTNGFNDYYYGIGGEIGFDEKPYSLYNYGGPANTGLTFIASPWTPGSTSKTTVNEVTTDAANLYDERVICSTNANQWYARYWMGEIYPDDMAAKWIQYGNLPTTANTFGLLRNFFRNDLASVAVPTSTDGTLGGFSATKFDKMPGGPAITSFYNGSSSGGTGGNYMEDQSNSSSATLQSPLGIDDFDVFQFPLPASVNAQRAWDLGRSVATMPPEWNQAPYKNEMTTLSIPSITTSWTNGGSPVSRILYNADKSGETSSGVIKIAQGSQVAYSVASGTSPGALSGLSNLAETALMEALGTFLDAGQMAVTGAVGHIPQLPLVQLYTNPVPQFSNPSSIPLTVASPVTTAGGTPVANIWYRYAGLSGQQACFYTPEYPGYVNGAVTNLISNSTYAENVNLVLNLKYEQQGSATWFNAADNSSAVTGILDVGGTSPNYHAVTLTGPFNTAPLYSANITTSSTYFPQGNYRFIAEVWRLNTTTNQVYPLHYAYHYLDVTITR